MAKFLAFDVYEDGELCRLVKVNTDAIAAIEQEPLHVRILLTSGEEIKVNAEHQEHLMSLIDVVKVERTPTPSK